MNATPTDEHDLTAALTAVAESDPVDETAAWQRIRSGIDADRRRRRRRTTLLFAAGLAAAASAAAAVLVVAGGDRDREAVEVVPPATETDGTVAGTGIPTAPDGNEGTATTGTGASPAAPSADLVVASLDGTRILRVDPVTGATTALATAPEDRTVADLELAPDGTVYVQLDPPGAGDPLAEPGEAVFGVEADGTFTPVLADGVRSRNIAVSPDGARLAVSSRDDDGSSVLVLDRVSLAVERELRWAEDEEDFFLTQGAIVALDFSPDGTELLLSVAYEGNDLVVVDLGTAETLSDGRIVGGGVEHPVWLPDGRIVGIDDCCFPDDDRNLGVIVAGDADPVVIRDLTPLALAGGTTGVWAQVGEGLVRLCEEQGCVDTGVQPDLGEAGPLGPVHVVAVR